MKTMQSYHIETFGDVNGIALQEHDIPQPGEGEVLVQLKAASLNRRDLYILQQTYPLPGRQHIVPLSDGAGEVAAVGRNVSRFQVGDRVTGTYFPKWQSGPFEADLVDQLGCTINGMLSEYALLDEDWLVKIPEHLCWEEAATLPCAALTAWSSLTGPSPVFPGETVLTIGTGGVSLFAIQFAKLLGANVIALTSRNEKADQLQSLGATHILNYRTYPNWSQQVLELTGGKGVNRVVETGGTDTLEQSIQASAIGGQVALLTPAGSANGASANNLHKILTPAFVRLVTLRPLFVGNRLDFEKMNQAISHHQLHPVIDRVFAFTEAKEAYRYFSSAQHLGKVIISSFH
jgi:NADPH:quinone reductase-like Zn-dependent oxidoreductase